MLKALLRQMVPFLVLALGLFSALPLLAQPNPDPMDDISWNNPLPDRGLAASGPGQGQGAGHEQNILQRKAAILARLQQVVAIDQDTLACVQQANDAQALRSCQAQRRQRMQALKPVHPHGGQTQ